MIVIIEGPDGAGKTTLARAIQQDTGWQYIHANAPAAHPLIEYTAPLSDSTKSFVLDRWHLGEMVYGPLHRGGSRLSPEQFVAVEQFLDERGAVVVLCNGTVAELSKHLYMRGDKPHATLAMEARGFDKIASTTWLPVLKSPCLLPVSPAEVIKFASERYKFVCNGS